MHPVADTVLDRAAPAVRELARAVFAELFRRFPDAVVTADADRVGLGTAPGYGGLVLTVAPGTNHVTVGFAHGVTLPDPAGLLEGAGKVHRHVKVRTEADLRRPELGELFAVALERVF